MTVSAYVGEKFSRTHENQGFDQLLRLAQVCWGSSEERVVLIGNVTCNGHELDALLIKPDAIVVIDFKNFGGKVEFSENGPWRADGQEVKGGSRTNPFKQIQANKFGLMDWLKRRCTFLNPDNNLGHISGLVLFQQDIEFDPQQLPPRVATWFNVADYRRGVEWLAQLASPSLFIAREGQDRIVTTLGVMPYESPNEKLRIFELPDVSEPSAPHLISWTTDQQKAIDEVNRLLVSEEPSALLITGMTSTGKTLLVQKIAEIVADAQRELVALAPNAPLANVLSSETGSKFRSIYGHVYALGGGKEDKDGRIQRPMSRLEDSPDAIYIIDEAQLLGDDYFDVGTEVFGSGHTLSDFFEFAELTTSKRRLIVMGDSYQIRRGAEEMALVNPEFIRSKGLKVHEQKLEQVVDDDRRQQIVKLATKLVTSIRCEKYNSLNISESEPEVRLIENSGKSQALLDMFDGDGMDSLFISFSNATVKKVTEWVRSKVKSRQGELPQPGDRIELFRPIRVQNSEDDPSPEFVPNGSFGTVTAVGESSEKLSQTLKGREQPVELSFRSISVVFDEEPTKIRRFLFLEMFILLEKPELDKDTMLALRVSLETRIKPRLEEKQKRVNDLKERVKTDPAKNEELAWAREELLRTKTQFRASDPYFNAAHIRYAYASTCHHAQGRRWPDVMIDAGYDNGGRDNEAYFRWLYTAITRADSQVRLADFVSISPLDRVRWQPHRVVLVDRLKSIFRLPYPKDASISSEDQRKPVPEGMANLTLELVNLWLYASKRLDKAGMRIVHIKQNPYQEQYSVSDEDGRQAVLGLTYNGTYEVTAMRRFSGELEIAEGALACLREAPRFSDALAQSVLETVVQALLPANVIVEGGKQSPWRLALTVLDSEGEQAILHVNYTKEGRISSISAEKATGPAILERIGQVLAPVQRRVA